MKRTVGIWLATLVAAAAFATRPQAAEPLDEAAFAKDLAAARLFEYGQDPAPLNRIEEIVVRSVKDPAARPLVEAGLVRALQQAKTYPAKDFFCRQLRTIGTARCVWALEPLLVDPETSHMARYALGRIESPEACAVLCRALKKTRGKTLAGVIETLGKRRCLRAEPELERLLLDADPAVAAAAATALGRIGGRAAAETLLAAARQGSKADPRALNNALLKCAERLAGAGDVAEARKIYRGFRAEKNPLHLRLAGLRGLVLLGGPEARRAWVGAVRRGAPELRPLALALIAETRDPGILQAAARLYGRLSPELQEILIRALAQGGRHESLPTLLKGLRNQAGNVRLAAMEALGDLGAAAAAEPLAQAAATARGAERRAALASLARLKGDGVDAALIRLLDSGAAPVKIVALQVLAARGSEAACDPAFALAQSSNRDVRREAIRALGALTPANRLSQLAALAARPRAAADLPAIEEALRRAVRRAPASRAAAALVEAADRADPQAKPALLALLPLTPSPEAFETVLSALSWSAPGAREAAVRALAEWPKLEAAGPLLALARNTQNRVEKALALRGYIRLARLASDPGKMYQRAMELAAGPDERKLVLAGLADAETLQALELAESQLHDPAVRDEAALAVVKIADRLRARNAQRARKTLDQVLALVSNPDIRGQAQNVINEMEKYQGYILLWQCAGPYQLKGKESREVFDAAFAPETPGAPVKWRRLTKGLGDWDVNLAAQFGAHDHCAAYLRTRVWSPKSQKARLELGSDDAVKAWLNGKLVHAHYTNRALGPAQDKALVQLKQGWNDLMLKVVNHGGPWGFCARVRNPDGSAVKGLKVQLP